MSQKNMFLIFVFILFLVTFCACIDTISFNQSLSNGDLLVSSGKKFALGFFSPGNSNKRYVGIWYNNVPEQTLVWVANRDNPITSNSGVFTINPTGNLVILDRKKNISAWHTNISSRGRGISYSAQLLDSGNFVLFQDLKREVIIWQSFDYPTNTILPDMKFGIDKKAGLNRSLTSWKSMDDPGSGGYVYKFEIHGMPQNFLYKDSNRIWSTGAWTGLGWSGVPEMKPGYIFTIDYVDNVSEASVTFRMLDSSVISRLVLNESGMMTILNWQENKWVQFWSAPKDRCDNYEHCGTFSNCNLYRLGEFECSCLLGYEPRDNRSWYLRDGSHGCMRKKDEKVCKNGEGFAKLTNVKVPDTYTAQLNMSMELQECEQLCLNNCSCTAYASANVSVGGIGCITWYGDLIDTREFTDGGQDFYIRVSATQLAQFLENPNGDHSKRTIAIVVVCVSAILITVLFACFLVIRKRRKDNQEEQFTSLNTLKWNLSSYEDSTRGNEMDGSGHVDVLIFELSTMISATDDFSDANKLGEGGFGSVYKGLLNNAQEIAVKRLSKNSGQGVVEFKNEVTLIARVQHRNLVRLLGCCIQRGEKMLVYEYLPNKGLDNFIFDKTKGPQLDWRKRYEIIVGIARGLSYLHHDSRVRIIHRDLKASNVLLDASMHPKISDFGTARIFGGDQIEANTNRVVGTYGYMAPEYAMEGHFSVKSDVFSFGVLLLEIITGRKNATHFQDQSLNLVGYVWDFWSNEKALDVVDPLLGDSYEADEILRCIQIGLLCVQSFANDRPLMSEVVFMLCNETKLSNPGQPGFLIRSGNCSSLPYSSSASVGTSVNDITITAHKAR